MTCNELKSLIAANGGPNSVYGFQFDNAMSVRFKKKNPFKMENLVSIGGVDYYKHESKMTRHSTKMLDVTVYTYYKLECLQQAMFYRNVNDQYDVDFAATGELR